MLPFEDKVTRLCTIPGVDRVTAWGMLAEIGMNMNQFPSSGHLASWACLCPGSFESAGKREACGNGLLIHPEQPAAFSLSRATAPRHCRRLRSKLLRRGNTQVEMTNRRVRNSYRCLFGEKKVCDSPPRVSHHPPSRPG